MKRASLAGVLGLLGFALAPATAAMAAPAGQAAASPVTYHGTPSHATRVAKASHALSHLPVVRPRLSATARGRIVGFRSPAGSNPATHSARAQASRVASNGPVAAASVTNGTASATVQHRFNGLSDADQAAVNGGPGAEVTPPDQGLCVGRIGGISASVVIEMVNSAVRVTTKSGAQLLPDFSLADLFQDPYAEGDPRCLYDAASKSFYFTEIGFPPGGPNSSLTNTTVDVAVLNARGLADYQFDTSLGGKCLGDQPKTGFSNKALIVSTDEYCGRTLSDYQGAIVLAISRPQLLAEQLSVAADLFGPVSLGGIPGLGLDPAIGTGTSTAYLVNSFPYDAAGNNNEVSSSLGLWTLKSNVLTGRVLHSESYAFPVPAASTGTGTATGDITSEAFLDPGDSRTSGPVNVTRVASGDVQLWTALDSAIAPTGDPTARDGAAWFKIDTGQHKVVSQGYLAAKGKYLLYPAVQKPASGPAEMVVSVTSPTINPSSAFTTLGSGKIRIVAAGSGPHVSFSDVLFGTPRWGDYSFTALSPGTNGVWLATEYIPPPAFQDPADNWGTSVFEVAK